MKTHTLLLASLLGLTLTQGVLAADLSYNFAELSYINLRPDGNSKSLNGFGIQGSFDVGSNFYVNGYFQSIDSDWDTLSGQLGYRFNLNQTVDFYAQAGVIRSSIGNFNDNGVQGSIGIRALVAPQVELGGFAKYTDVFNTNDKSSFGLETRYKFNQDVSAGLHYEHKSNLGDFWTFSGRFNF